MNNEPINKMDNDDALDIGDWPLWKIALRDLRNRPDFGYGMRINAEWFEEKLNLKRDQQQFCFQMLDIKSEIENEDGYAFKVETVHDPETTQVWFIPLANEHEDVAQWLEKKMRSCARRAGHLRLKTLNNDTAELTASERSTMETNARIAATRMVLLSREKSITDYLKEHAPRLIKKENHP